MGEFMKRGDYGKVVEMNAMFFRVIVSALVVGTDAEVRSSVYFVQAPE